MINQKGKHNSNWKGGISKDKREYHRNYYYKRKEKQPDINKIGYEKRKNTKSYKKAHQIANKKWSEKYPERRSAELKAQDKIHMPKGQLCEICKKNKAVERHHDDYSKPLEVKLVCNKCHREIHKNTSNSEICENCGKEKDEHKSTYQKGYAPNCAVDNLCKKFKSKNKNSVESDDFWGEEKEMMIKNGEEK